MYFSRIFVGILLLLSIVIMPSFAYASNDKSSSPLMQLNNGTSTQNIACSNNLELIYKSTNDYPICVKPQTAENLIKRDWAILQPNNYLINISGFLVHYNITGGNIQGAKLNTKLYGQQFYPQFSSPDSLFFSVKMTSNGMLNITLPRALIGAVECTGACGMDNSEFIVLKNNDQGLSTEEFLKIVKEVRTSVNRTLSIQVPNDTEVLKILYPPPVV